MINYILNIEKFNENFNKIDDTDTMINTKEIKSIMILQEIWNSIDCNIEFFNKLTMEDIDVVEKMLEDSYSHEMSLSSNDENFKYDNRTVSLMKSIQQTEHFLGIIEGIGKNKKATQSDLF